MFCVFLESGEYLTKRNKTSKNIGRARMFDTIHEAREAGMESGHEDFDIRQVE